MLYRILLPKFVRFLDGLDEDHKPRWPAYRPLRTFSIRNYPKERSWAFSEREYRDLKQLHVARTELAAALVDYLAEHDAVQILAQIPEPEGQPTENWLELLTSPTDGRQLRQHDYYRSAT